MNMQDLGGTRETIAAGIREVEALLPAANAVTAVFRGRALQADAEVRIDFESSDHAWVARSELATWLPRVAFPSMAAALTDWGRTA